MMSLITASVGKSDNSLGAFWRPIDLVPGEAADDPFGPEVDKWLTEEYLGPGRWKLPPSHRAYYLLKGILPVGLRRSARRLYHARGWGIPLSWPVEDRLVRLRQKQAQEMLKRAGVESCDFVDFWPAGSDYALVITHDVETAKGLKYVPAVAETDLRYGVVSSFNFVPEDYDVTPGLREELRKQGFEVGVHGLRHDGRLFRSRRAFDKSATLISRYLRDWGAVGFRAPLTHRNPEWMQSLDIEYDSSFFDTDPFEPMPGGTGSIWPYFCGRFVELPYTLPQDHTLFEVFGETTPAIWLEKVEFIAQNRGMVLVNVHPDYLVRPGRMSIYEEFLAAIRDKGGYWNALPRDVAKWWRLRAGCPLSPLSQELGGYATTVSTLELVDGNIQITRAASHAPIRV